MSAVRVLVADVDPATHLLVEKALDGRGYEIAAATDGEQALDLSGRWHPDVVIVEPELPKVDGLSFVRQLRTRPEAAMIPAFFLAERERVEPRIVGFKIGADDYLPKPVDPATLESRLAAARQSSRRVEEEIRGTAPEGADFSVVMTGFRGNLDQIGLSSLMTLMEIEHKTGTLVILLEDQKDKARIFFYEGRPVRAALDRRPSPRHAELIFALLNRTRGKFDFRPAVVDPKDEIRTPTMTLLLEGARRIDENQRS